jgi:pyridoxamine 5'-phosphate oxidase-like protein
MDRVKSGVTPTARRPFIPDRKEYGKWSDVPVDPIDWQTARERLTKAPSYWIVTVSPKGRPRAAVTWGIWLNDALYIPMSPESFSGKNADRTGQALAHPADPKEVLIVEGTIARPDPTALPPTLADAFEKKYDYRLDPTDPGMPLYQLTPRVVRSWHAHDVQTTAMRWDFETTKGALADRAR